MPLPKDQRMPESSKLDMQKRQATLLREGGPGLFKEAAKELYNNPAINTAISLSPIVGDAQAGLEAIASAREGDWAGAGLNALGVLPFVPALGGIVAGPKAKTADLAKLLRAQEIVGNEGLMSQAARDAWKETGWFRGADKKWRFEIPDNEAVFRTGDDIAAMRDSAIFRNSEIKQLIKDGKEHPDLFPKELNAAHKKLRAEAKENKRLLDKNYGLSESTLRGNDAPIAYKHDALYEAYPYIKDSVVVGQGIDKGAGSKGMLAGDRIDIYKDGLDNPASIASHEFNHKVQDLEGFASGGMPSAEQDRTFSGLVNQGLEFPQIKQIMEGGNLNGFDNYRRLAGEVESRMVQKRMNYTPEQRASIFPLDDMDVPVKRQIVRFDGGKGLDYGPNVVVEALRKTK